VAQRLPALQHAPQDDLDAARRADALDPAVGPLALAVVGLVLVAARLRADLLAVPGRAWAGADAGGSEGETAPEGQLWGAAEDGGCSGLERAGCRGLR